jgi:hypothetical protein
VECFVPFLSQVLYKGQLLKVSRVIMECAIMGKFCPLILSSPRILMVEKRNVLGIRDKFKFCSSKFKIQALEAETHLSSEVFLNLGHLLPVNYSKLGLSVFLINHNKLTSIGLVGSV